MNTAKTHTMETVMSKQNPFIVQAAPLTTLLATLLVVTGCREDPTVDPNNSPEAVAEVKGEDPAADGAYAIDLSGDSVELTLDGSESTDRDGEVVDYVWISGTLDPEGSGGRFVPDGEDADWPKDGKTSKVELGEGHWVFHLYVEDDKGALSSPSTIQITVGDPPPIPTGGAVADSGDGAAGGGGGDCVEVTTDITGSAACAECACGQSDTCAADVSACDATCWGLISCVATECAGDGTDIACIGGACGPFIGAATPATAAGPCAAACADECAM